MQPLLKFQFIWIQLSLGLCNLFWASCLISWKSPHLFESKYIMGDQAGLGMWSMTSIWLYQQWRKFKVFIGPQPTSQEQISHNLHRDRKSQRIGVISGDSGRRQKNICFVQSPMLWHKSHLFYSLQIWSYHMMRSRTRQIYGSFATLLRTIN